MHFGFELLCVLNPRELRDFFTGFFRLPDALWEHFLSWRLSGAGHVWMGGLVWWACIPKRFMAPMLLNSLPHLLDKLVGPFLSRGGDLIGPHTPYTEARWRPDAYYAYLADSGGPAAAREGPPPRAAAPVRSRNTVGRGFRWSSTVRCRCWARVGFSLFRGCGSRSPRDKSR